MKSKPIPPPGIFDPADCHLQCRPDGRVVVKDGRTLEEYINDPRLVERRKSANFSGPMVLTAHHTYLWGIMGRCA